MGILETIRAHWAEQPTLTAIVPAERVFLGPPNPGSALPCVGLVSEQIGDAVRTSTGRYPRVTVGLVAQSSDLDLLETLRETMRDALDGWSSGRYGALQLSGLDMRIERPDDRPTRLWIAEATITYDIASL